MSQQQVFNVTLSELKSAIRAVLAETNGNESARVFLTPEQVGEELQIDAQTIRLMCRRGELRSFKIGKFVRIERKDLDAFLNNDCDRSA